MKDINKEFDEKAENYDKDGGFIVYVEGYDNKDFNVELIKQFIKEKMTELAKEMIGKKDPRSYDGNDLESACKYYCISAKSWEEIIRYENGVESKRFELIDIAKKYQLDI